MEPGMDCFATLPPGVWDFFFIRHGESQGNKERIIQGHSDYPLTSVGMEHARAAGEWFTQEPPDSLFSSPLGRAKSTAQILCQELGIPIKSLVYWDDLKELDTGIFSGKSVADILKDDPETWEKFLLHSWQAVPGAESVGALQERAKRVWQGLCLEAKRLSGQPPRSTSEILGLHQEPLPHYRILSVSHGGMIQWLFKVTFATGFSQWFPVMKIGNCGIFQLQVRIFQAGTVFSEWKRFNELPYTP